MNKRHGVTLMDTTEHTCNYRVITTLPDIPPVKIKNAKVCPVPDWKKVQRFQELCWLKGKHLFFTNSFFFFFKL